MNLSDRIEALDAPCREMDAEIALASGWSQKLIPGVGNLWIKPGSDHNIPGPCPRFTASIDAAMMLCEAGMAANILRIAIRDCVRCCGHGEAFTKALPRFIAAAAIRAQETGK